MARWKRPEEEAAMAAEPFVWLGKGLDEGTLGEVVGQSIGAASMCWVGGTGSLEFDSEHATEVSSGLMAYLCDYMDGVRAEANAATSAKMLLSQKRPLLGLARTNELLEELEARLRGQGLPWAEERVVYLLNELPELVKEYRTTDG